MTKKILILIVFVSIVFSQGRYERVDNWTRFDTKTGETEYLRDGKWYTNTELIKKNEKEEKKLLEEEKQKEKQKEKLQLKQIMPIPRSEISKVKIDITTAYEGMVLLKNSNSEGRIDFTYEGETDFTNYILFSGHSRENNPAYIQILNLSKYKIEEIDLQIDLIASWGTMLESELITIKIHKDDQGIPSEKTNLSYYIIPNSLYRKNSEQKLEYSIKALRGYDSENPPKLSWWE